MSKSILVIDTPNKCEDCVLYAVTEDEYMSYCCGNGDDIEKIVKNGGKSDQCPLIFMPEKKKSSFSDNDFELGKKCGYNNFIDEILNRANGNE